jgi:hypothetical protein
MQKAIYAQIIDAKFFENDLKEVDDNTRGRAGNEFCNQLAQKIGGDNAQQLSRTVRDTLRKLIGPEFEEAENENADLAQLGSLMAATCNGSVKLNLPVGESKMVVKDACTSYLAYIVGEEVLGSGTATDISE